MYAFGLRSSINVAICFNKVMSFYESLILLLSDFALVNQTNGMHKNMVVKMMCAILILCTCQIFKLSQIMKLTCFCCESNIFNINFSPWGYWNTIYHPLKTYYTFSKVLQFKQTSFTKFNLVSEKKDYELHLAQFQTTPFFNGG